MMGHAYFGRLSVRNEVIQSAADLYAALAARRARLHSTIVGHLSNPNYDPGDRVFEHMFLYDLVWSQISRLVFWLNEIHGDKSVQRPKESRGDLCYIREHGRIANGTHALRAVSSKHTKVLASLECLG
jgi:hypothetical protein